MSQRGGSLLVLAAVLAAGCATSAERRLASGLETLCKHCNCLMPSRIQPDSTCTVCHCQKKARQCVLGP